MLIQGYKLVFNDIGHKYLAAFWLPKIKLKAGNHNTPAFKRIFLSLYCLKTRYMKPGIRDS